MPTIPPNNESLPMNRDSSPIAAVGRLIALPTTPSKMSVGNFVEHLERTKGYLDSVSFEFPAMPDVIELARQTDYFVSFSPNMPDGIHQYRGTRPLEIPISFKLHAFDPTYCKERGALTLLQLAARLHSFILPVTEDGRSATAFPVRYGDLIDEDLAKKPTSTEPLARESARTEARTRLGFGGKSDDTIAYDSTLNSNVYELQSASGKISANPPVTCLLHLIWVAEDQPGISCIGYVKDVRVKLMGPWLRGPNGSFNLPSMAEYEFTFVHRPSHGNNWNSSNSSEFVNTTALPEVHAFSTDVRNKLFNTRSLVLMANYRSSLPQPANGAPFAADLLNPAVSAGQGLPGAGGAEAKKPGIVAGILDGLGLR